MELKTAQNLCISAIRSGTTLEPIYMPASWGPIRRTAGEIDLTLVVENPVFCSLSTEMTEASKSYIRTPLDTATGLMATSTSVSEPAAGNIHGWIQCCWPLSPQRLQNDAARLPSKLRFPRMLTQLSEKDLRQPGTPSTHNLSKAYEMLTAEIWHFALDCEIRKGW